MKKSHLISIAVLLLLLFGCTNEPDSSNQEKTGSGGDIEVQDDLEKAEQAYEIVELVSGLEIPWDMAFTSENRMLITERPGRLRVFENGVLNPKPIYEFTDVSTRGEEGLMSVELDPEYQKNKWIYLSWAYPKKSGMAVKVVRFTDAGNRLENETVIIDNLPAAQFHAGCRLAFGPDGKLYITVGDAFHKQDAQDLSNLAGKILRLNKDGSIPNDNPFSNSPIWSYGHRNPQGIDWHPETGELYETEHGPSVIDGPTGGDEVNHIEKGQNYGWPVISHDKTAEGMHPPMIQFTPAEPPGSLLIYSGKIFPQFKNDLFFGSLKGEGLVHLKLSEDGQHISGWEKMEGVNFGRIRNVVEGPDGLIYFSTSNRDGRGKVQVGDDRIFVVRAK